MARLRAVLVGALASAVAIGSCTPAAHPSPAASRPNAVTSNVLFADYAGSRACESCHADHVRRFFASPMHNMTRDVDRAVVRAPWNGATFRMKDDTATLETANGARFMTLASTRYGSAVYRVTRVIGGHHREDYAGIPVAAVGRDAPRDDDELVLPVSFVYATGALRYKGYSVMVKERAGLRAGPVWNQTCIFCHNTVPYIDTVLGALAGPKPPGYQGEVVDPLLPSAKRASYVVTDEHGLETALEQEMVRLGAKGKRPSARDAIGTVRARFRASHLVEVGIGCESCHLGSAEHARIPSLLPSFVPKSSFLDVRTPAGEAQTNRLCARCHQVLFSGYEPTWEGGSRHGAPGGSHINSGEARDMMLGACSTKLTCTACHDPHAPDGTARLRALAGAEQDALCTRCHDGLADRRHTHHDPAREGARCIACHMPKKNMSLDGDLTRYHRIGSPTEPTRVHLDRPLECALCHADKTVGSLVATMESWYPRKYDREGLAKLYGSIDANVILATAERGRPHEQAVAFQILGDTKSRSAAPLLASQLTHPYPLVRGYAKRALEAIEGRPVPIDLDRDDAEIDAAVRAWLKK